MKRSYSQTPGGNRLRALRDDCGKTQLEVELDASLGIGYLQRVESGKVRYPERDTLERILAALGAHYTERAEILELFGYRVDTPLPDEAEIGWAVDICRAELNEALFPVYLLDCAHQLLAWNRCFARLFPVERFSGKGRLSMPRLIFDPAYGITQRIANQDEFFAAQIRAFRYQMRLFRGESWYERLIDDLNASCPLFRLYWERAEEQPSLAARPLIPLMITQPAAGAETLHFRLTSEPFAQDRRFRILYYLPADSLTMQQCVAWVSS